MSDESLDIKATRYRSFVAAHSNQTNYFQPILDRLQVVPSRFDLDRPSAAVEGKSDYYILRYAARLLKRDDVPLIPGLGAGTFGALIALNIGWNLRILFVLDGDKKGKEEQQRYISDYGLSNDAVVTLDDLTPGLSVIEDLLDKKAKDIIASQIGVSSKLTKNQIRRFFQECLAKDEVLDLGDSFRQKVKALLDELNRHIKDE